MPLLAISEVEFGNFYIILEGTKTISGNTFIQSKRHWVIGLKMMIFLIMMSNNYTCLKGTPCFLPKTKREGGGVFPLQAGQ